MFSLISLATHLSLNEEEDVGDFGIESKPPPRHRMDPPPEPPYEYEVEYISYGNFNIRPSLVAQLLQFFARAFRYQRLP